MKKKRRTYVKLFNIPSVAKRALAMLSETPPQSYSVIASKLGCTRASVIYFHKKKIQEGVSLKNFNGVTVEIIGGTVRKPEIFNEGMDYKDYLKTYTKEKNKLQKIALRKAKKTIDKIRKTREKEGTNFDYDYFEF